jgi:hypothetical protein
MANKIKSISFLYNGERLILHARCRGTFHVPVTSTKPSTTQAKYKNLTAKEVVEHKIIKDCDPVLTLNTGEKLRVYQGGDSSYLPAMVEGLLNKHDLRENNHRSFKKLDFRFLGGSPPDEQCEYPWESFYYDGQD